MCRFIQLFPIKGSILFTDLKKTRMHHKIVKKNFVASTKSR